MTAFEPLTPENFDRCYPEIIALGHRLVAAYDADLLVIERALRALRPLETQAGDGERLTASLPCVRLA